MTDFDLEASVDGSRAGSAAFDLKKIRKGKHCLRLTVAGKASPLHSSSSIPTPFETIINRDKREKAGFNKTSPRFPLTRLDDEPGPGLSETSFIDRRQQVLTTVLKFFKMHTRNLCQPKGMEMDSYQWFVNAVFA